MRFWDSSALVALLFDEEQSDQLRSLLDADRKVIVSFLATVELESAIARRSRGREPEVRRLATARFEAIEETWTTIDFSRDVMHRARRASVVHALRAGDAIQLASALAASSGAAAKLPFVTTDEELIVAARAEGFPVLP